MSTKINQDSVFMSSEGNAWYERNAAYLDYSKDPIVNLVKSLDASGNIESVCDLGCADGSRLAKIQEILPSAKVLFGIDPSLAAIKAGKDRWKGIEFLHGTIEKNSIDRKFDMLIVSGVLCWIDRTCILASIARLDSLLNSGGLIILSDFFSPTPRKNKYHHRDDVDLYTYKQDYSKIFIELGHYRELHRTECSHGYKGHEGVITSTWVDEDQRWAISLLKKKPA